MFIQFKNKSGDYTYTHKATDISLCSNKNPCHIEPHYYVYLNSVGTEQGSFDVEVSQQTYDKIVSLLNQRLSIVTI